MNELETLNSEDKMKHTPGPWRIMDAVTHYEIYSESFAGESQHSTTSMVVPLNFGLTVPAQQHVDANAALIKAAPDLLMACQLFLEAQSMEQRAYAVIAIEDAVALATTQQIRP